MLVIPPYIQFNKNENLKVSAIIFAITKYKETSASSQKIKLKTVKGSFEASQVIFFFSISSCVIVSDLRAGSSHLQNPCYRYHHTSEAAALGQLGQYRIINTMSISYSIWDTILKLLSRSEFSFQLVYNATADCKVLLCPNMFEKSTQLTALSWFHLVQISSSDN